MKTRESNLTRCRFTLALRLLSAGFVVSTAHAQDRDPKLLGDWSASPAEAIVAIQVEDGYAYCVLPEKGRLAILDVRAPDNPYQVGSYDTPDRRVKQADAGDVVVSSNRAYLTFSWTDQNDQWLGRFEVIDVSNPVSPRRLGGFDTNGIFYGMAVAEDLAYIAAGSHLQLIDVANPTQPRIVGTYPTTHEVFSTVDVAVWDRFAYVVSGNNAGAIMEVLDISDPANPQRVGSEIPLKNAYSVSVSGNFALVASANSGAGGLTVLDISDPIHPVHVSSYNYNGPPEFIADVTVLNNHAYLAAYNDGLMILDVNDPTMPRRIGGFSANSASALSVAVDGRFAYISNQRGLSVVDISVPSGIPRVGYLGTDGGNGRIGFSPSGEHAYLAAGYEGFRVIDIRNAARPLPVAEYNPTQTGYAYTRDTALAGHHAFVTRDQDGLHVLDVSNPLNPRLIRKHDGIGTSMVIAISSNYLYLGETVQDTQSLRATGRLTVLDVQDPANPTPLGTLQTTNSINGMSISGHYLFQAVRASGWHIVDVSDPTNPTQAGFFPGGGWSISIEGRYGYFADGEGLKIVDVSDVTQVRLVGKLAESGSSDVFVSGPFAYLADGSGGLQVIDVSDPAQPRRVARNTGFSAGAVQVYGGKVYVSGGDGLIILNKYTDLRIGPAIVLDDGRLQLQLRGASGQRVRVQRSTNLRDWADWQTVTLGETGCQLTDTIVTNSQCFYRAVEDNQEAIKPRMNANGH